MSVCNVIVVLVSTICIAFFVIVLFSNLDKFVSEIQTHENAGATAKIGFDSIFLRNEAFENLKNHSKSNEYRVFISHKSIAQYFGIESGNNTCLIVCNSNLFYITHTLFLSQRQNIYQGYYKNKFLGTISNK